MCFVHMGGALHRETTMEPPPPPGLTSLLGRQKDALQEPDNLVNSIRGETSVSASSSSPLKEEEAVNTQRKGTWSGKCGEHLLMRIY